MSNAETPRTSTYRTMRNFLRNPQGRGILQDEGDKVLALLQVPAWVAVQHLHGSQATSAAGNFVSWGLAHLAFSKVAKELHVALECIEHDGWDMVDANLQ